MAQPLRQAISSRKPSEPAAAWLGRLLDAMPPDSDVDDELLDQLWHAVNGSLGEEHARVGEDPEAYRDFWARTAARLPSHPLARAAYADTLLLTGDTDDARPEMLAAFESDPTLIYKMSGEWRDVMERAGGKDWVAYRALAVRAAVLDDPSMHEEYIAEELRGLIDDLGDDQDLRREALRILEPPER